MVLNFTADGHRSGPRSERESLVLVRAVCSRELKPELIPPLARLPGQQHLVLWPTPPAPRPDMSQSKPDNVRHVKALHTALLVSLSLLRLDGRHRRCSCAAFLLHPASLNFLRLRTFAQTAQHAMFVWMRRLHGRALDQVS